MSLKIIVLAKQVPDTRNVSENAMKADGTVNRAALPAIFNPDDLNALEQALLLKDKHPGTQITLLTMGPPRAAEIIREALYRGIDRGYLITDRRFAGADTLATSYVLFKAIEKIKEYDLILCGRQAIDGDTAQVGPQIAQQLDITQVTYLEEILSLKGNKIKIKRRLEQGVETVETPLPILATVHGSAQRCRPKNAKLFMKYKHAKTATEKQANDEDYLNLKEKPYLEITEFNIEDLDCDLNRIGLKGSPTKVKTIENVVLKSKDSKILEDTESEINDLIKELLTNHTLG